MSGIIVLKSSGRGAALTTPGLADSYREESTMAQGTCAIDGCEKPIKGRGWCSRHYEQWRLNGYQHDRSRGVPPTPAHERVLRSVDRVEGGCWIYKGAPSTKRPTVTIRPGFVKSTYLAVYEALVGPVPDGFNLHHTCEQPRCVNPEHLELMTRADHTRLHKPRLGTGRKARADV